MGQGLRDLDMAQVDVAMQYMAQVNVVMQCMAEVNVVVQ